MAITILLFGAAQALYPPMWIVLARLATGEYLGSFVVEQQQLPLQESDLVWYVEEFALKNPYAEGRAQKVAKQLDEYSTHLAQLVQPVVSRALRVIVENARKKGADVQLYFSRPGTWGNLGRTLREHRRGFFSVAHFDLHGVRLSDRGFRFRFSPPTYDDDTPEDIDAEAVADLLSRHSVRTVLLNACNSGSQPPDYDLGSAAHVLVSHGISEVIAMSYSVTKSTALDFITAFYTRLLQGRSTVADAVKYGRDYLRSHCTKEGRFGMPVQVQDDLLPVLYQCSTSTRNTPGNSVDTGHDPADLETTPSGSLTRLYDGQTLLGRDNDFLSVEAAVCEHDIVKVVGDHGVGKTSFANHLLQWWRETGFVDRAFAIDCSNLSEVVIDNIIRKVDGNSDHKSRQRQERVLVCVDNFNIWMASQGSDKRRQWDTFQGCVSSLKAHFPKSKWLLLGRVLETNSAAHGDTAIAEHQLEGLTEDEAARFVQRELKRGGVQTLQNTREVEEQLEEFTDLQGGNPLTIALLGSTVPFFGSFSALRQRLKFEFPGWVLLTFNFAFSRNHPVPDDLSDPNSMSYLDGAVSSTLHEFQRLIRVLESHSELALQIAFALSSCQSTIPFHLQEWAALLFQPGGILSSGPAADGSPMVEASAGAGTPPTTPRSSKELVTQDLSWVLEHLMAFGFIAPSFETQEDPATRHYDVHPLLPFLLRYEIAMRGNASGGAIPTVKLDRLPSILWYLYELRVSSLMRAASVSGERGPGGVPMELRDVLERERVNIYNSADACLVRPEFGYRPMHVLELLLSEAVTELSPFQARAQIRVLGDVLHAFEQLSEQEGYKSELAQDDTVDALAQIMILVCWRGNTFLAAGQYKAALDNAERGGRKLEVLTPSIPKQHRTRPDLKSLSFILRCQKGFVTSYFGSGSPTDALSKLLAERPPEGSSGGVARLVDISKFMIRSRYLMAKADAEGGPNAISFRFTADIYAHTLRGSEISGSKLPNHDCLLARLEDPNLDEAKWSTELKPALDSAFVEHARQFLHSAAMSYLWRTPDSNRDDQDGRVAQERLHQAIEVARMVRDMKTEICALDKLFLLMAGKDAAAATKIHEELATLERDPRTSQTFFWPRMGERERSKVLGLGRQPTYREALTRRS
ncbi:hypothetical protein OQA88_12489 [Cercophora sp. LCS_1]